MIDKNSSKPIYLQIREYLQDLIENEEKIPGDKIPSEPELAKNFSISRMTARKAVDSLVTEGVLYRQPGKGTFVARPKAPFPGASVTSFSKTMIKLGYQIRTEILQQGIYPVSKRVTDALKIDSSSAFLISRIRFIENQPVAIHYSYMRPELEPFFKKYDMRVDAMNPVMEEILGIKIMTSSDSIEATLAEQEEAQHLQIKEGAPVILVRGEVYSSDNEVVRVTKSIWRGDRVRFSILGGAYQFELSKK